MMLRAPAAILCLLLAAPCVALAQAAGAPGVAPTAVPATAAPAATVPAPAPAPRSAIPYKQEKQGGGSLAWQSLAGLVLASLAAYGIILALKKFKYAPGGALRTARRVSLLESTRLSRRSTLHVVDYHGEELLLAESEHGIALVSSRPAKETKNA